MHTTLESPIKSKYTMYGAHFSLYSGKLRAYLVNKGLTFDEVLSTASMFRRVIIPKTGVRFIPVLETPEGVCLQDTAAIIDALEARHPSPRLLPATPKQHLFCRLFELYADEWLLIAAMHYRWNHDNFPFVYQEFGSLAAPRAPAFIRSFIGKRLGAKFRGFVPLLGITDATIPSIEAWFEEHVLAELERVLSGQPYLLGEAPSVADCALMGPLYAHIFRDPGSGKIMRRRAPHVAAWVERMNRPPATGGQWCSDDAIPEPLKVLLQGALRDFWPVLTNTVAALADWAEGRPKGEELPRALGQTAFSVNGVEGTRVMQSFHVWKLQRVIDAYEATIDSDARASVDRWLAEIGGSDAVNIAIPRRVERLNNRIVLA
ncbi:MAG: glutathione S-transferase family protein [Pseudomonadota bacterium]